MKESHPLFEAYPITGERGISIGKVPVPYHIYDGHGSFIGGTANLSGIQSLLNDEKVHPIQTIAGHAVMGIWALEFTDASLDPHNELQFSVLVSHQPVPPIEDDPLTILKALFTNAQARMFCFRLWNNTEKVVAYNRELLGLPAGLNRGHITFREGAKQFHFEEQTGKVIFEGRVRVRKRTSLKVGWHLLRLMGLRNTLKSFSEPYLGAKIVNPISENFPYNADAQSYVAPDMPVIQFFDPVTDSIQIGHTETAQIGFQPQFIEHFEPFRFVYLQPERPSI